MLQIKNLSITHKKDLTNLLVNFTFTLNSGDKAVIIGEEGNGKSTLLKLIFREDLVSSYALYSGEIIKHNEIFGYLPQELPAEDKEKRSMRFLIRLMILLICRRGSYRLLRVSSVFLRIFSTLTGRWGLYPAERK